MLHILVVLVTTHKDVVYPQISINFYISLFSNYMFEKTQSNIAEEFVKIES